MLIAVLAAGWIGTATAGADCDAARFQRTEPIAAGDTLPFNFHIPSGWRYEIIDREFRVVSLHKPAEVAPRGDSALSMDVGRAPSAHTVSGHGRRRRREAMPVIAEVPYKGASLRVYQRPWDWADGAKLLLPHSGRKYSVIVRINNESRCPAEAQALRELFFATLTPNPSTTFAMR
ncbi:MAG: hypothetical protein M5U09_13130 [Gammaproteobacteria bacterium]|nr:hypothetical protein [Gammaproteobacteria bacterium]